jgi:hypothetical protein
MLKKIGMLALLCGMMSVAQAQDSLGDLVNQAGVDWLMGDWQTTSDRGDTVQLSFKGDLDNHVAFITHKDQRTESKGIVIVEPGSTQPKYYAGDKLGGSGTGVWSVEDGKAILKYKHTAADGKVSKMGITFAKVDADTMEVNIYSLSDSDELGTDARVTTKFKRTKK